MYLDAAKKQEIFGKYDYQEEKEETKKKPFLYHEERL